MRTYSLVIAAKEQEYVRRLAEYMRDAPAASGWQVTACTKPQSLRQYIKSGYPADLLLIQPEFREEIADVAERDIPIILLVPYAMEASHPCIVQYQALPKLVQQLNRQFGRVGSEAARRGSLSALVVSIFSTMGGMGKTTLAINIAREAANQGKRVFYFNLESYNVSSLYFREQEAESEENLSRLLYVLQSQPQRAGRQLAASTRHDDVLGVDYFAPAASPEERLSLPPGLASAVLTELISCGQYDLIMVDLDSRLDDVAAELMGASQLLLWLTGGDATSRAKLGLMLEHGRAKWGGAFAETERKMRMLQVYSFQPGRDATPPLGKHRQAVPIEEGEISLPYILEWRNNQDPLKLLHSPLYRGTVQRIIRHWLWQKGGAEDAGASDTWIAGAHQTAD